MEKNQNVLYFVCFFHFNLKSPKKNLKAARSTEDFPAAEIMAAWNSLNAVVWPRKPCENGGKAEAFSSHLEFLLQL